MKSYECLITPLYMLLNNQSYEEKTSTISIMEDILFIKSLIGRPDGLNRLFCKP